jgi:NAD(P)-dependent dehydrogenase (short-subunit alcohol dehydrogenase family)
MKSVIITGANGGLGLAVTSRILEEDYRVIAITGSYGAGSLPVDKRLVMDEVDVLDEDACEALIRRQTENIGGIDAAVLLVGGFAMGKLTETSHSDLERMISLNFFSAFNMVRPLLRHFLSRPAGGRFILVGARPGLVSKAGKDFFAYSLSKSMVFKLAEMINAEGEGKNVSAVVIVPSVIDTEMNRKSMPDADFSNWVTPEQIAGTIAFYLSEESSAIREAVVKVYNRS